jgi:hypothetical protein
MYRAMMSAENGLLAIRVGGSGDDAKQRPVALPEACSAGAFHIALSRRALHGQRRRILIAFDPSDGSVITRPVGRGD